MMHAFVFIGESSLCRMFVWRVSHRCTLFLEVLVFNHVSVGICMHSDANSDAEFHSDANSDAQLEF